MLVFILSGMYIYRHMFLRYLSDAVVPGLLLVLI